MQKKIKKKHIDYSCGFPVVLLNVPMVKIHDDWVLDINYDDLAKTVLLFLSKKPLPLTGNEIRFIRYYFGITMREFAHRLGVKHPAIVKWEEKMDQFATVTWGIEKDIRLFILDKLCRSNKDFREGYKALEDIHGSIATGADGSAKIQPLQFTVHDGHLEKAG
jgi:transcriptional regulator with XRE-family HTH domain